MAAIEESDVIVFMVDGRDGPQPLDHRIADVLRRSGRPVILVVNKWTGCPPSWATTTSGSWGWASLCR